MYLMYYMNEKGERVYTLQVRQRCSEERSACFAAAAAAAPGLPASPEYPPPTPDRNFCLPQKNTPDGSPTYSAHPARFSPDDKFSKERLTCKKRFGLLPTQQAPLQY